MHRAKNFEYQHLTSEELACKDVPGPLVMNCECIFLEGKRKGFRHIIWCCTVSDCRAHNDCSNWTPGLSICKLSSEEFFFSNHLVGAREYRLPSNLVMSLSFPRSYWRTCFAGKVWLRDVFSGGHEGCREACACFCWLVEEGSSKNASYSCQIPLSVQHARSLKGKPWSKSIII